MKDYGPPSFPTEAITDLSVEIRRLPRARRMTLRLSPTGDRVLVTAPKAASDRSIEKFLIRNSGWIFTQSANTKRPVPFAHDIVIPVEGVEHVIVSAPSERGLPYRREGSRHRELVVPGDAYFLPRRTGEFLQKLARERLTERCLRHSGIVGISPARINVKDTTSRWGSCSPARHLSFSWRLILAPPGVLDYVAAHEVAHLREMNHGPRFWKIVESLDPDMAEHMKWLKANGAGLHCYGVSN